MMFSGVDLQFLFFLRYDLYSFSVIPAMGELVTRDRESYQYLVESIRRFPPQVKIKWFILDYHSTKVLVLGVWG